MYRPVGKDCGRQNKGAAKLYRELFGGEAASGDEGLLGGELQQGKTHPTN
jgi:hypothetical protein